MNTGLESVLLISAIFGTFALLTAGMYRRFTILPSSLAYQYGRTQLLTILIIGVATALIGNVFKNPFANENSWILAKDTILIFLAIHLIILLANGLQIDIYNKRIPSKVLHITSVITGIIAIAVATILAQGKPNYLQLGAKIGSFTFITLTGVFFALLMTGIIIRIAKRTQ